MKELNEKLYEAKLVYYTPTFDDKVRVFCTNPSGEVATEYYDDGLAVVNGPVSYTHLLRGGKDGGGQCCHIRTFMIGGA